MNSPRHIWAVGRNYLDHAKEMNADIPIAPLFFLKAGGCLIQATTSNSQASKIVLPAWATNVHHELEIALRILKKNDSFIFSELALAIDLTERDRQAQAKKKGEPWTLSKSFTGACPVSKWISYDPTALYSFQLSVNGTIRQSGDTTQMIFSPDKLLNFALGHFPIESGDVLLTGTPAGVAQLKSGDHIQACLFKLEKGAIPSQAKEPKNSTTAPILTCHWSVV